MPAALDLTGLHNSSLVGYTAVTGISDDTETTIFTGIIASGEINSAGSVFDLSHFGRISGAAPLTTGMDLVFRLKFGSSMVATATLNTNNGTTSGSIVAVRGNLVVVSATTAECHLIGMTAKPTGGGLSVAGVGSSNNSAVVTTPDFGSGSITVTMTAQFASSPVSVSGVYTARLTTFSFNS